MILYDKITKTFGLIQVPLRNYLSVGTRPNTRTEFVVSFVGTAIFGFINLFVRVSNSLISL